jgi:hypothetical protein
MENTAFFKRDGDTFLPQPDGRGPWNPNSLHGRVVIGLAGFELERLYGGPEWVPARLTVDMYRLPDFSPITVTTRFLRDGKRIKVVDADLSSAGKSFASARAQFLLPTQAPGGTRWSPANWDVPHPDNLPPPDAAQFGQRMWKMRRITGNFGETGIKRAWMSEIREMVEGYQLTPFTRVAAAVDFASPFANSGDQGLGYINTDITVYLHRLPKSEWIGFETTNHQGTDGVAIAECFLYDLEGPIGTASAASLAQSREPG